MTDHQISLHGLGFIQVQLEGNQRLHVWHPDLPRRKCWEHSNVHNHRFAFKSRVLVGRMADILYDFQSNTGDETHVAYSHEGDRLKTGNRPWTPVHEVKISEYQTRIVAAGEEYHMTPNRFHSTEILADDSKVATVILKGQPTEAAAKSLCEIGVEPDTEFDRFQVPADDLWSIVRDVLAGA